MRKLLFCLGSAPLAITLIGALALFVIAGTFIESLTDSHQYASLFTYSSPLFAVLIWLLFINILVSALLRWPFQKKHIPFLMTHLGLLMILSGVIVKNAFGIQGTMSILEGGTSQHLLLPDTQAVYVQSRDGRYTYELNHQHQLTAITPQSELTVALTGYYPHSEQHLEGWIKGKRGVIAGLPHFPVSDDKLNLCCRTRFFDKDWNIYAMRTNQIEEHAKAAYIEGVNLIITDTKNGNIISQTTLNQALENNQAALMMSFSLVDGFVNPVLIVENKVRIPLSGPHALVNENLTPPYVGKAPITVDLERIPSLVFLEDEQKDLFYFAFDEHGRINQEPFRYDNLRSVVSYDDGYDGYAVSAKVSSVMSRAMRDQHEIAKIDSLLRSEKDTQLAPPLHMLREAAQRENKDFPSLTTHFLDQWERNNSWLLSNYPLPALDWESVDPRHLHGCQWIAKIMPEMEEQLKKGVDLVALLEQRKWPLLANLQGQRITEGPCRPEEVLPLMTALSHQIVSVSDHLPIAEMADPSTMLSAYFRLFGIHLSTIRSYDAPAQEIVLESPLTLHHERKMPLRKLEDNIPLILLEFSEGNQKEKISLAYDRFASGLKWPVVGGKYLVRFQPRWKTIPYKVHLRDARQINYANTQQPYSFESDLVVTDMRTEQAEEKTISMNNVYQTWDGYRFYLSNISPGDETTPQRVQIIVNYDPTKYWLTYPGAMLVSLGIVLLFWLRPYRC